MPRRHFVADLAAAVAGVPIAGISNVQPAGDDGEFTFTCLADGQALNISALIPGKAYAVGQQHPLLEVTTQAAV